MTRNSMSLYRLLATAMMPTLFSSAWLPLTHSFAKMGWLSQPIQIVAIIFGTSQRIKSLSGSEF